MLGMEVSGILQPLFRKRRDEELGGSLRNHVESTGVVQVGVVQTKVE